MKDNITEMVAERIIFPQSVIKEKSRSRNGAVRNAAGKRSVLLGSIHLRRGHDQFSRKYFRKIIQAFVKLIVRKKSFVVANKIILQAIVKSHGNEQSQKKNNKTIRRRNF